MSRDLSALLVISDSIQLIGRYTKSVDQSTLAQNIEKQDAILRRITIIGEATKRLTIDFRSQHPTTPWKQIAGIRDVITYDYDEIDLDEIGVLSKPTYPSFKAIFNRLFPKQMKLKPDAGQTHHLSSSWVDCAASD